MFKKNVWIVGLLAALAIMFAGCVDQYEAPDLGGEDTEVLNLANILKDKNNGALNLANPQYALIFDDNLLSAAGYDSNQNNVSFNIVEKGGVKGIEVTTVAYWAGFDLNNGGIGFRPKDVIKVEGYAVTGGYQVLLNLNHGGWDPLDGWNPAVEAGDAFSHEFVLGVGDIGKIKGATPKAIRVRTNASGAKFVITQITVNGKRGGSAGDECLCIDPNCPCKSNPNLVPEGGCGPQCELCTPERFPGKGSWTDYEVPASTNPNEFYLNIANFTSDNGPPTSAGATGGGVPTASYSKNSVKFYFDRNLQRVNFIINDVAQRDLVIEAINAGEGVDVEIDGTSHIDAENFRYGFINPDSGSGYNATNLPEGVLSKILKRHLERSNNATHATTGAFTLQLRGSYTGVIVEIKSIKIIVPAKNRAITIRDLPITAPVAGEKISRSFTTAQFNGSIKWDNEANSDKKNFTAAASYKAEVTLKAKNVYWTFDTTISTPVFTVGSLTQESSKLNTDGTVTVVFNFASTVTKIDFPGNTAIKPQIAATAPATGLVDLTDSKVLLGTAITATYTKGTDGPAESSLTYRWQSQDAGAWTTIGNGKTFTPAEPGTWRILISNSFYNYLASSTFAVSSSAMEGELDAALNAQFTREGTKVFSFAEYIESTPGSFYGKTPFNRSGSPTVTNVAKGWNVLARTADSDCPNLVINGTQWGHDGLSKAPWNINIATTKYKVTYYGVIVGAPPSGTKAVIQNQSGPWNILAESAEIKDNEGSFKITWEIPSDFTSESVRIATNNTASYRITLVEVEDLGAR